jgi:hypothetical protein
MTRDSSEAHLANLIDFKQRLQVVSLTIASLDLFLLLITVLGSLAVNPNFLQYFFGSDWHLVAMKISVMLLTLSATLVIVVVIGLFYFERLVKGARILSAEFADQMGWYSEYSLGRKPSVQKKAIRPRKSTKLSSTDSVSKENETSGSGEGQDQGIDPIAARTTLREIAENSYLPLVQSDLGPTVYAAIALLAFFAQVGMSYVSFRNSP